MLQPSCKGTLAATYVQKVVHLLTTEQDELVYNKLLISLIDLKNYVISVLHTNLYIIILFNTTNVELKKFTL